MYSLEYEFRQASSRVETMRALVRGATLDDPNRDVARQAYNIRAQAYRYLNKITDVEVEAMSTQDAKRLAELTREKKDLQGKVLQRCLGIYHAFVEFSGFDPEPDEQQGERDGIFNGYDED